MARIISGWIERSVGVYSMVFSFHSLRDVLQHIVKGLQLLLSILIGVVSTDVLV